MKVSKQSVELIDCMGTDLSVVNAARVSFEKESNWDWDLWSKGAIDVPLKAADAKLLKYLAEHNHWSPFSHASLSFRIKAPIFVARQLGKHQVGMSWNEVSRRYVDSEPEFYVPEYWRKKAANVKQGSSDEKAVFVASHDSTQKALWDYQEALDAGVCPEQARMLLPQSMMTEWIWSGSLYAFARVCNLRLDSHTQKETQEVAAMISDKAKDRFPESWSVLVKQG